MLSVEFEIKAVILGLYQNWFNSHAGGMPVARPYDFEIDFVINPISGSAAWFFVIILEFVFTLIFEIKIYKKNTLTSAAWELNFGAKNIRWGVAGSWMRATKIRFEVTPLRSKVTLSDKICQILSRIHLGPKIKDSLFLKNKISYFYDHFGF